MRVLVTGATGFIGRQLLYDLQHCSLRAAVRTVDTSLPPTCEQVLVGNIHAQTEWGSALAEVDCIVHLAAHVHVMKPSSNDWREYYEVNVAGTERLARAAARSGVKRFIFLSSVKVNGEETFGTPFASSDSPRPHDEYGKSKWEAEQQLSMVAAQHGLEVLSIRSPLVYGPNVRANFLRLMSWTYHGIPLPFGAVRNRRSMVSVWNLCDLVRRALATPNWPSAAVMVSDGEDLATPDLVRRLASALGRKARLFSIPAAVLRAAGACLGQRVQIARLCGSLTVDVDSTMEEFGWRPPLSVDEGLSRTAKWYLSSRA